MRRSHAGSGTTSVAINLTPLIDVVFILLIFFVINSSFVRDSGIDVERPGAASGVRQGQGNIVVTVTGAGEIHVDRKAVDRRSLKAWIARLQATEPGTPVLVMADTDSRTGLVVEVIDQARLAGAPNVAIATRPRDDPTHAPAR